ncbi:NAD dependent epimerase/dehydratase family protein [Aspergillus pseudodeflectus]|uniref:NAD dependent epimerase/dehydratase family protein n=1 Tax=Aspergillus pseudodeflectus TaxID=176178 RepID=A0ABR4JE58_9EURO
MPTALVTGATGLAGNAIVQLLLSKPEWTKVITLSRSRQVPAHPKNTHLTVNLCGAPRSIIEAIKDDVQGLEYVIFCAYLADPNPDRAYDLNVQMLQTFITALRQSGAMVTLKRVILVTGLKQYGVQLGRPKLPMHETDPWLEGDPWPKNFYYGQQKTLIESAREDSDGWSWVVTYPQDIIGVARGNFMNLATALGLYLSVSAASGDGEIPFPGARETYLAFNCWTSARLHAEFCVWAALTPAAGNQGFNVTNGDTESWQHLWPKLVQRYSGKIPPVMFPGGDTGAYGEFEAWHSVSQFTPAIAKHEERIGLKGEFSGRPNVVHQQIDTLKWSQRPEVRAKWEELRERFELEQETWEKATWRFATFLLGREFSCVVSMSKARRLGWTGYVDTWDAFEETLDALEREGILPPANRLRVANL